MLKRWVLQLFQNEQLLKDVAVDITTNNVAEDNGVSNIVFVNVVEP